MNQKFQPPLMSAVDIVKIQLEAMKNNKRGSGIKKAYFYASPYNRNATGPYSEFSKMVRNNTYRHLLNCLQYKIYQIKYSKNDLNFNCLVEVISNKDNRKYIYKFELSRQFDFLNNMALYDDYTEMYLNYYWRTNSVLLVKSKDNIEKFKKKYKKKSKKKEKITNKTKNIYNDNISVCSSNPMTGYFRDGICNTDETDSGTHVVCAKVDKEFLKFTKSKGNNLSTPSGPSFPGLKENDKWCLCALRWKEAQENGKAPKLDLKATNKKALEYIDMKMLENYKI